MSSREACVTSATAALRSSIHCLLHPSPESLDRAEALLREAQAWLQPAVHFPESSSAEARLRMGAGLADLKHSLVRVCGLLDHAAGFYAGWVRLRNSLAGGYTAQGQPADVVSGNRLSLEA